jgi:hypothetical protein
MSNRTLTQRKEGRAVPNYDQLERTVAQVVCPECDTQQSVSYLDGLPNVYECSCCKMYVVGRIKPTRSVTVTGYNENVKHRFTAIGSVHGELAETAVMIAHSKRLRSCNIEYSPILNMK